jgi:predicted adenylyl cyclase CyaB
MNNKEIEVRFIIKDLPRFIEVMNRVGASCIHSRYLEINELFDTPDKELNKNFQILRLRTDWKQKITYKRALTFNIRDEIEFEVSNIDAARAMIKALGYERYLLFEKYRTTFAWQGAIITIDETALGCFVEIENQNLELIEEKTDLLNLSWDTQVRKSYYNCFLDIKKIDDSLSELTFNSFGGWMPTVMELGLEYAD